MYGHTKKYIGAIQGMYRDIGVGFRVLRGDSLDLVSLFANRGLGLMQSDYWGW